MQNASCRWYRGIRKRISVVLHNRKSGIVNPVSVSTSPNFISVFFFMNDIKTDSKLVWRLWAGNYLSCSAAIAYNVSERERERGCVYILRPDYGHTFQSDTLKLTDILEQWKQGIHMELKINAQEK